MTDAIEPRLCEIFTKSFVMSAQKASSTLPEKTITEHLIGFTAFATAFGAVTVVEILTPGLLKKKYAVMVGKAAKQGADYLVEATKKSKWSDDTLKIKEIIQRGDPTAKTLYCDLFQCYFTNLAIEIYFCFEEIIVIMCTKKKINVITGFEEFGKFAGKLCYASCKGAEGQEETIQNFIDFGFFDKLEHKFRDIFNFSSKFEKRAQKLFTQTIPAWCPNTQNSRDTVVVETSVWNKNKKYTLRPPFRFEQEHLSKLWNGAKRNEKTKQFSRPSDFQSFCYKEHQDMVNNLILEIQYDETLNPEKAIMHRIRSCAKEIIAEVNKHTDEIAAKNKKKLSNAEPEPALFVMDQPSPYFIGRNTELFEIHEALQTASNLQGSLPLVIITGPPGMGKTETARKYALTSFKDVYSVIISINAVKLSSLGRSFIRAMKRINSDFNPAGYDAQENIITLAEDLYCQLSNDYKAQKILLVFDNAIQKESNDLGFGIGPFLPKAVYETCFYVLITSQNQNWDRCYPAFTLNKMESEDVNLVLTKIFTPYLTNPEIGFDLRRKTSNLMQHILMGYPLGIRVATAIILDGIAQGKISQSEMSTKIQNYISKFNTSDKMIAHKTQTGYSNGIKDKLDLAIECIEKEDNGTKALELFHMMSYLSPGDIDIKDCYSVFYFEQQNLDDPSSKKTRKQTKELDKCINLLKNMSLITRHGNQFIEVHQLVQKIIRQKFKANVGNLNMWFKPLPFVLDDPYKHALHVFTNICSTSSPKNIPIYALLSMYSEFKYFHEHRSQHLLERMNRKIKKLIKKARRNVAMELHGQNFDLLEFLNHVVCITDVGLQTSTDLHIPGMFQVMEKYMDDLILQYIGINVVITSERPLTQVIPSCMNYKRLLDIPNVYTDVESVKNDSAESDPCIHFFK